MAEEHRCHAPHEGPRLCANNCGYFGSPATLDLCSKCYRDVHINENQKSSTKGIVNKSLLLPGLTGFPESSPCAGPADPSTEAHSLPQIEEGPSSAAAASPAPRPRRCTACKRKLGLTGFRCRCGETFCGSHRYPELHACSFDFKSAGQDAIARANPVVKSEKLEKI